MKYNRLLVLIVMAGCQPNYTSGKTECSDKGECPSGYLCSSNGTAAVRYCVDSKTLGCPSTSTFYCPQSNTCWVTPGACSTVTFCGTTKNPGNVICVTPGYVPDCNGTTCNPPGGTGTGGNKDAGVGPTGSGGIKPAPVGTGGSGGSRDAGVVVGTGGVRDAGLGVGGAPGRGGAMGFGGSTSSGALCSGVPLPCSGKTSSSQCLSALGCAWNAGTLACMGTPSGCTSYASSTYCMVNGCTWAGALVCTASPVTTLCSSVTGSGACTDCVAGSCCTSLTNCVYDTNCSTNSAGPVWDAYLACTMNCCRSSCGSGTTAVADNLLPGAGSQAGQPIVPLPRKLFEPIEMLVPQQ